MWIVVMFYGAGIAGGTYLPVDLGVHDNPFTYFVGSLLFGGLFSPVFAFSAGTMGPQGWRILALIGGSMATSGRSFVPLLLLALSIIWWWLI